MRQDRSINRIGKGINQVTVECSDQFHYLSGLSGFSIYNVNHRLLDKSKLIVSKFLSIHIAILSYLQKNLLKKEICHSKHF